MLKKRLVGVITVKDGWAVQSFEYSRYLPLGHPECLAENLDRWGADEIVVLCIDRSRQGLGPDLSLLKRLGALGLSTPLAYGGGIRSAADAAAVVQSGADRVCVDAILRTAPAAVREMAAFLGAQALIGVLPMSVVDGAPLWRNYLTRDDQPLADADLSLFTDGAVSEALLVDWRADGCPGRFDVELVERFPLPGVPLIAFGGLNDPATLRTLFSHPRVVAGGVGNFLAYSEHAVQRLRNAIQEPCIRPPQFAQDLWP